MRLLILPLLLTAFMVNAQNKQAILIAIAEYPSESGWSSISSDKDVELLLPVYEAQGFQNPVVVRDKAANKEGILSAMRNFRDRCKPGDIVLVHYSGHGQQIADNNGDEPDGLDEALVAWGAPAEYYNGYNGEKHLRDDEFNELLLDIRGKIGSKGNMLVVVDACHSGTISRGVAKKRGGKAPLVPPGYQINSPKREDGSGYAAKTRGQAQSIAPMVLISASSFDEENSETFDERGVGIGSLSYAMAKSLSKVGENYSYRSLFADVLGVMNEKVPQQTPMVEGDVDYALFAGQYYKQEQYYDVREIKGKDIILNGGSLMGIYPETKVAFYPAGTISPNQSKAVAYGVVSKVSPLQSIIKPDAASAGIDLAKSWVFITEPSLGNVSLSCNIVKIKNPAIKKDIEALLATKRYSAKEQAADISIVETRNYLSFIRNSDGTIIDSIPLNMEMLSGKADQIMSRYAQNKYLRELKSGYANSIQMQLLPCDQDGNIIQSDNQNSLLALKAGSYVKVKVTNKGNNRMFYNIIDIQPDGQVNAILPMQSELTIKHAEQYVLEAGAERILPFVIDIAPPFGNEVFKLFASNEPFNLVPFIASAGLQTRGSNESVISAFKEDNIQTRGAAGVNKQEQQQLITNEVVFRIVE
jgi:hypothetical protein